MPYEMVRLLNSDHPYRYDGTAFGGTKLWTPSAIATALWLDADSPSTITLNGSTVSQWSDKSGNGRHATQATATNQPTYVSSAINAKPALSFDGTNDFLNLTDGTVPTGNTNYSMFVVQRINVMADMMIFGRVGGAGGSGSACYLGVIGSNVFGNWWAGTGVGLGGAAGENNMYSVVYDNATSTLSSVRNGLFLENFVVPFVRNSLAAQQSIGGDIVNNNRYGNIAFSEAIVLHSTASVATRQTIEGYLAWKWGLEANLPSDHPYKLSPPTV